MVTSTITNNELLYYMHNGPEDPVALGLVEAFESGHIAEEISSKIYPNFRYAYMFEREGTSDEQLTYIETVDYDEQMEKQMRERTKRTILAPGSSLRKLKTYVGEAHGVKFHNNGIEHDIRIRDLNSKKFDFWRSQEALIRELRIEFDQTVFEYVKQYCGEVDDSEIKGAWKTNDLEDITADLIRMRQASDFYDMNVFATSKKVQTEVGVKASIFPMQWEFPTNGYLVNNTIMTGDCPLTWGGEYIGDEDIYMFDMYNPGLKIWYADYSNDPRMHTAPNIAELPAYAPLINTFTVIPDDEREPILRTQYLWGIACEPIERGKRMFHYNGVLTGASSGN